MTANEPEPPAGRTALLLGATGLVGGHCLDAILESPRYRHVCLLARRRVAQKHPKLEQRTIDFDQLAHHADAFRVDDIFCCLGTTIDQAGSQDAFRRVDLEYVVEAARLAAEGGADQFLVVSSLGADPDSRVFYNRVKGEMEGAVKRLPFGAVWILRPSLLLGDRQENRMGERVAARVGRLVSWLLVGPLRRYRPIEANVVARAMLRLAAAEEGTGGVVESEQIADLGAG